MQTTTVKALSLWEPWASLIAQGEKTIETRFWGTSYRGPLLICAAKAGMKGTANAQEVWEAIGSYQSAESCRHFLQRNRPLLTPDFVPQFGKAVALVELYHCRRLTQADGYDACMQDPTGKYGLFLRHIRPIQEPFAVRGKQGLFHVEIPASLLSGGELRPMIEAPLPVHPLYTWGYQGRALGELRRLFVQHKIGGGVVDVRRNPRSRYNPDFNREKLELAVSQDGFTSYYHAPHKFGNVSHSLPWVRPRYWREGCQSIARELQSHSLLLLCLERDPSRCHRSEVAKAIQELCGCEIIHLGASPQEQPNRQLELFSQ